MASGTGVCDVAGGKGYISCRLWLEYGIPCTVIEPRDVTLKRRMVKAVGLKGVGGFRRVQAELGPTDDVSQEGKEGCGQELRAALEGCSILIGMHPDQATGAIVDAAWQYRKPFAMLPVRGRVNEVEPWSVAARL